MTHNHIGSKGLLPILVLSGTAFLILPDLLAGQQPEQDLLQLRVICPFPGVSPEEVERQVTIPLEAALAGIPGCKRIGSRSVFGFVHLHLQLKEGAEYWKFRQEIINRLSQIQGLPPGASPLISPTYPGSDLLHYTLTSPRDALGQLTYSLSDLRALQDWEVSRFLRRVAGVTDVLGHGGTVKRYEVQPDPDRLRRYGITLKHLADALARDNVGGDVLPRGKQGKIVGIRGVLGDGKDPMEKAWSMKTAREAAAYLRAEDDKRCREIRQVVITTVNNVPVRVDDVVAGGPAPQGKPASGQGVLIGQHPRSSIVVRSRPTNDDGANWIDEECVAGIVELRWQADQKRALADVRARFEELNAGPGRLLSGVRLDIYHDRSTKPSTGPLWLCGAFPAGSSLEKLAEKVSRARSRLQQFPEVNGIVSTLVGTDDEISSQGLPQACFCLLLRPEAQWPAGAGRTKARSRQELAAALEGEMQRHIIGSSRWRCADSRPTNLLEGFVPGSREGLVKIFGSDLETLAQVAERVRVKLADVPGVAETQVVDGHNTDSFGFQIDRQKCRRWGVQVADVNEVIQAALVGRAPTQMVEGEKAFDVAVRWPEQLRKNQAAILDLPVDASDKEGRPRLRLADLVVSGAGGEKLVRAGVSAIYREEGKRMLPVWFRVQAGPQIADVIRAARKATGDLLPPAYKTVWEP